MARTVHAAAYRIIPGRIGGIDEAGLNEPAGQNDQIAVFVAAARKAN